MTFPMLLAYASRTAAILEGINERLPNSPRDLPDMMRDLTFPRTIVESQVALALIADHPDEPASEMVSLARHAIARCRVGVHELEVERPALPSGSDAEDLVASYRRVLAALLEGANVARPSIPDTFGDILPSPTSASATSAPSRRSSSSSAAGSCRVRRSPGSRRRRRSIAWPARRTGAAILPEPGVPATFSPAE